MKNPFRKDIILVILLTVVSTVCIVAFPLTKYPINLVSYIPLALFLPGYAFMAAKYPLRDDIGLLKRIIGSIIISVLLTLLLIIISNIKILGISISSAFLLIGIFTIKYRMKKGEID
jgi:uncharacterized membrane protein